MFSPVFLTKGKNQAQLNFTGSALAAISTNFMRKFKRNDVGHHLNALKATALIKEVSLTNKMLFCETTSPFL